MKTKNEKKQEIAYILNAIQKTLEEAIDKNLDLNDGLEVTPMEMIVLGVMTLASVQRKGLESRPEKQPQANDPGYRVSNGKPDPRDFN